MKTFQQALRSRDFVITAELPLRETTTAADIRDAVKILGSIVDAVQIGDNYAAKGHVDPLAAAAIVLGLDVDPVMHLSCRDRNRVALKGALVGAAALGVTSVILTRGQKLPTSMRGKMKGVFDTKATQLIEMARRIGEDPEQAAVPAFYVGSFAPVIRPRADWEATQILEKIAAGSQFLQTRPCLNVKILRSYMTSLVSLKILRRVSLVVDVPLLSSAEEASELKETYPGVRVPDAVVRRISDSDDPVSEGVAICAEVLNELTGMPGVSGANVMFADDAELVARAIRESGLRAR